MKKLNKNPALYIFMFLTWAILAAFLWYCFITGLMNLSFKQGITLSNARIIFSQILIVLNAVFITYFWLNGVKDFIYVIWYYCAKSKLSKKYKNVIDTDVSMANDRVLFLYCTCNDFEGSSLLKCMNQDYKNYKVVILDDSSKEEYIRQVDSFAKEHEIEVVRRQNRVGFKAGNINHYLLRDDVKGKYDYAVILDSDEIIPNDFIKSALKYFYYYNNVGIVQANHVSTRNSNLFMRLFHIGVNSHWPTYQGMKHRYGFSTMLGHGAMIKRECYEKAGGFPPLVAEDLCLSIEARNHGYLVTFAPEIICMEEYPVDYFAFKKRHSKWTQGNLEFIKKYTGKIVKSKMSWFEKWDIVLFTYNLPLTAIFAFYIFLNLIALPLLGVDLSSIYQIWMIVPTIVFFFSPMLNDFITWMFRINPLRFVSYFVLVVILYGSMLTTSLISALLGMLGKKAKFIVTPKSSEKITILKALRFQLNEFIFSSVLLAVSLVFTRSAYPVILIVLTGYLSFFLAFLSNKRYKEKEYSLDDTKTTEISLRQNKAYLYKVSAERNSLM
ncbi:MAG TPA: glycosyl transferase family 2 [Firmicutes bacterium]|nr:glycosyl transferase family 2 [Bacillota bacterium]